MKKLIITCALLACASVVSFGQAAKMTAPQGSSRMVAAPSPEAVAQRNAKVHERQLKLNPEQYKAVYDAELNYAKQDQQARAGGMVPGPGQSAQMTMAKDESIKKVLTSEQYAKYQAGKTTTAAKQ